MPTYEYRCTACDYDFEVFQKFTDQPLTVCPQCGSELRKVFSSVGIVFKGSGFYSTDNHSSGKRSGAAEAPTVKTDASDASETKPAASESKTPAPAAAAA